MVEFPAMASFSVSIRLTALLCCWMVAGAVLAAGESLQQLDTALQQAKRDMLELEQRVRMQHGSPVAGSESVVVYLVADEELAFRLEQVVVELDGARVSEQRFGFPERAALRKGGAARLYSGPMLQGRHRLEVLFTGSGKDGARAAYRKRWRLEQAPGEHTVVEISLDNATFSRAPAIDMRVVD